jgi:hypothetical protein
MNEIDATSKDLLNHGELSIRELPPERIQKEVSLSSTSNLSTTMI